MVTMTQYARLNTGTHDDVNQAVMDITVVENDLDGGGDASPVAWADITGKPTVIAAGADAAAARTAIGAGTSSLTIGTAAATAAAGNHSHTATAITATAVGGGTATNVQAILAELAARIATLEAP
ncbi:hypothetical protein [Streptomyces albidoflavus]|uniref:hypothetical protein n=1 Tax=Streptomyces albidoflavus TaxID=1886 RepID=UPI0033D4A11D